MKPVSGVRISTPRTGAIPIPDESALIVNISESAYYAERTFGSYRIEARKPGERFSTLIVHAVRNVVDQGDRGLGSKDPYKNTQQFITSAIDVGVDLVRGWNTDIWGIGSTPTGEVAGESVRGFAGTFVADDLVPTEEELELATQLLAASDAQLTERAHAEWDQFHSPQTIHMGWKRAANRLGVDAPWLYTIIDKRALPDCPHCGSKLLTRTATVCSVCHRDVDGQDAVVTALASGKRKAPKRKAAEPQHAAA
jgi:hypothetical protein